MIIEAPVCVCVCVCPCVQRLSEHRGCQNRTEGRHGEGKREQQRHSPALTTPTHSLLLTETASTALVSSVHYNHHSTCAHRGGTTPRLLRARTVLDGLAFLHTAPAIIGARVGGRLWRGRHARRCSSWPRPRLTGAAQSDRRQRHWRRAARGSGGVERSFPLPLPAACFCLVCRGILLAARGARQRRG